MKHPPDSPNLSRCDCHVFGLPKKILWGEDMKKVIISRLQWIKGSAPSSGISLFKVLVISWTIRTPVSLSLELCIAIMPRMQHSLFSYSHNILMSGGHSSNRQQFRFDLGDTIVQPVDDKRDVIWI